MNDHCVHSNRNVSATLTALSKDIFITPHADYLLQIFLFAICVNQLSIGLAQFYFLCSYRCAVWWAVQSPYTLQMGWTLFAHQKCLFRWGIWTHIYYTIPWTEKSAPTNCMSTSSAIFAGLTQVPNTHRYIHHTMYNICSNRPHIRTACGDAATRYC